MNLATSFLESALKRFNEYKALGEKTFAQLHESDFLLQPNAASNSIAMIIQHMHGNMVSRWTDFLTTDGEKAWRTRDAEFDVQPHSKAALLQLWNEGWQAVLTTLESLKEEDLLKTITIRSQPLVVVDAINRQLAHYSYHVGQLVYLGKLIKEKDWESLSIPKGSSEAFNNQLRTEYEKNQ